MKYRCIYYIGRTQKAGKWTSLEAAQDEARLMMAQECIAWVEDEEHNRIEE